jgi:hypothetical protein
MALVGALVALACGCRPPVAVADIYRIAGPAGSRIAPAADGGRGVNRRFITGLNEVSGLAVGGRHIYWSRGSSIGPSEARRKQLERTFIRGLGPINA